MRARYEIEIESGALHVHQSGLKAHAIVPEGPVGATHALMAASLASGETIIENATRTKSLTFGMPVKWRPDRRGRDSTIRTQGAVRLPAARLPGSHQKGTTRWLSQMTGGDLAFRGVRVPSP
jgi:hypothetical protein